MAEDSSGTSKHSLTHALADAIEGALKGFDGANKLDVTVIVEGYSYNGKEYEVFVKVVVIDETVEAENSPHESKAEIEDRLDASKDLSEQMIAAAYARPVYDQTTPVGALEQRMDVRGDQSSSFDFDASQDNITLIAPPAFHDQLRADQATQFPQLGLSSSAPSLDLGGSSSSNKEDD